MTFMLICNDAFWLQFYQKSTVICTVNLLHEPIMFSTKRFSERGRQVLSTWEQNTSNSDKHLDDGGTWQSYCFLANSS